MNDTWHRPTGFAVGLALFVAGLLTGAIVLALALMVTGAALMVWGIW